MYQWLRHKFLPHCKGLNHHIVARRSFTLTRLWITRFNTVAFIAITTIQGGAVEARASGFITSFLTVTRVLVITENSSAWDTDTRNKITAFDTIAGIVITTISRRGTSVWQTAI